MSSTFRVIPGRLWYFHNNLFTYIMYIYHVYVVSDAVPVSAAYLNGYLLTSCSVDSVIGKFGV